MTIYYYYRQKLQYFQFIDIIDKFTNIIVFLKFINTILEHFKPQNLNMSKGIK